MSEQLPILQEIRNRFDNFGDTIGDRSAISSIEIVGHSDNTGYSVTSYPAGTYEFEGFTVNMQTPDGMFGNHPPIRVETFRAVDGIMHISALDIAEDPEISIAMMSAVLDPQGAREELYLPGDNGFELFEQLHREVSALEGPIVETLCLLGIAGTPRRLVKYASEKGGGGYYDYVNYKATLDRRSGYDVSYDTDDIVEVRLDGSLTVPFSATSNPRFDRDPMVFRAGTVETSDGISLIGPGELVAFAGLHATIQKLYR